MKKIFTFFLLSVLIGGLSNVYCQTNVSGNYFTNQTWSLAGNPYVVTGNITIPAGVTLTIQPGVEIQNSGNFTITINGNLIANGISALPIFSSGGSIMFRKTNLANSQISYFNSTGTTIQLADESEFVQDSPKNSDTLLISNSNFTSANIRTKGYQTTAALKISNSSINNTDVRGIYPRSEPIYLNFCQITNSTVYSESYNAGIILNNCFASTSNFYAGCCGGNIGIYYSTLINSNINTGSGSSGHYYTFNNSKIINTSINVPYTNIQNCVFKYHSNISLNLGSTSISNSSFIGNFNCNGGTGVESMSGNLTNVTVVNNNIGVQGSFGTISGSNFFNNTNLNIKHASTSNVTATGIYWGAGTPVAISNLIYDYWDDTNLGQVDYSSYVTTPNTNCPISPPTNVAKSSISGGIFVSWNANPEPDIAGYKIYYGTTDGINFTNSVNVGNATFYVLSGLTVNDPVFVTAYDNLADGLNDMVEGHESWYSEDIIPIAAIAGTDTVTICQGNNTVLFANNYPNIQYQWQKNGVNTGANADSLIVTQSGSYRVIETNLNGCKDTSNVVVVNVNSLSIQNFTSTIVCGKIIPLNNTINYIGNNTVNYSWLSDPTLDNIGIAHPNANPINTTTYTVNATDGVCQATATATITVNSLTANAGSDKALVCGGSTQLDNVSSNYTGIGTLIYSWSPSTGLNDATIANPTATITADQTYNVTVTTDNGCVATDEVVVTVNPLTVNAGNDKTIICGGIAQLDNVSSNYTGSGTLTYSWSPSTGLNDATIANPTATITADQTYNVTVTTDNGCSATDFINVSLIPMINPDICIVGVNDVNKNIIVWDKPVSVAIDSFFIYKETNITNVYQKIGSVPYDSLSVFVDTASQPSVQSNKYKISLIDNCNFETSQSDYHKTMHLSINQGVGTTWNLNWDSYEGFTVSTYNVYRGIDPNNLTLIGTSSGSNTSYSDISAPSGYVYYQVELVSPTPCNPSKSIISSRSNIATNNLSVGMLSIVEDNIRIYPNPATDIFIIEGLETGLIEIINSTGQVIKIVNVSNTKTNIDVSKLSGGVYTMRIKTNNVIIVKKLIKQ